MAAWTGAGTLGMATAWARSASRGPSAACRAAATWVDKATACACRISGVVGCGVGAATDAAAVAFDSAVEPAAKIGSTGGAGGVAGSAAIVTAESWPMRTSV